MPHDPDTRHPLRTATRRLPPDKIHHPVTPPGLENESLTCDAFLFDSHLRAVATIVGTPAVRTWETVLTYDGWLQTRQLPAATRELQHLSQPDLLTIAGEADWGSVQVGPWCRERWPDMAAWENVAKLLPRFPRTTEWRLVVRAVVW